jgi:hypothetical protein
MRGREGRRIRLRAKRLPSHWAVSEEDLEDFLEALTRDRMGTLSSSAVQPSSIRSKAAERADQELKKLGFQPRHMREHVDK